MTFNEEKNHSNDILHMKKMHRIAKLQLFIVV